MLVCAATKSARSMGGSSEGTGAPDPLEKSQNIGVLSNTEY